MTKQITFKTTEDEAKELAATARKNNFTVAEQVRRYVTKGMSVDAYQNDEQQILSNMKAALREVLEPQVERIVKINVKNAIASSVGLLYTSMLLYRLNDKRSGERLERFMEEARMQGIKFVQLGKGSIDSFLRTSMDKLKDVWGV